MFVKNIFDPECVKMWCSTIDIIDVFLSRLDIVLIGVIVLFPLLLIILFDVSPSRFQSQLSPNSEFVITMDLF